MTLPNLIPAAVTCARPGRHAPTRARHHHPLTEHVDSTSMFYRNLTPQQGFDRMEPMARRVAEVGGELHLL